MSTIEEKIKKAKEKRESLVLAEAEQKQKQADQELKARKAELLKILEETYPKIGRFGALREQFVWLLEESDQIMAREVAPAWKTLEAAAARPKANLEAFCQKQDLPRPNWSKGLREVAEAAPWVPLPTVETTNPDSGEIITKTHPAFQKFGQAFITVWNQEKK